MRYTLRSLPIDRLVAEPGIGSLIVAPPGRLPDLVLQATLALRPPVIVEPGCRVVANHASLALARLGLAGTTRIPCLLLTPGKDWDKDTKEFTAALSSAEKFVWPLAERPKGGTRKLRARASKNRLVRPVYEQRAVEKAAAEDVARLRAKDDSTRKPGS